MFIPASIRHHKRFFLLCTFLFTLVHLVLNLLITGSALAYGLLLAASQNRGTVALDPAMEEFQQSLLHLLQIMNFPLGDLSWWLMLQLPSGIPGLLKIVMLLCGFGLNSLLIGGLFAWLVTALFHRWKRKRLKPDALLPQSKSTGMEPS